MLREDIDKDEAGYKAVFEEQGASASRMAAARFLDTTSKLLGKDGASSDAVLAYTSVNMAGIVTNRRMTRDMDQDCSTTKTPCGSS